MKVGFDLDIRLDILREVCHDIAKIHDVSDLLRMLVISGQTRLGDNDGREYKLSRINLPSIDGSNKMVIGMSSDDKKKFIIAYKKPSNMAIQRIVFTESEMPFVNKEILNSILDDFDRIQTESTKKNHPKKVKK